MVIVALVVGLLIFFKGDDPPKRTERPATDRQARKGPSGVHYIGLLCGVVTSSAVYYFTIALPAHNRARLELERQKMMEDREAEERRQQQAVTPAPGASHRIIEVNPETH
jgi:hypothetical protein